MSFSGFDGMAGVDGMAGADGMSGVDGMSAGARGAASGDALYRPLAISPSREKLTGLPQGAPPVFTGERWPPIDPNPWPPIWPPVANGKAEFRDSDWAPRFRVNAVLAEFVQARVVGPGATHWTETLLAGTDGFATASPTKQDPTLEELTELRALTEYRGGALNEALAQRRGIKNYLRGVLNFTASSHRATSLLMDIAEIAAVFVHVHWKRQFARARPSRLDPTLLPPIEVPGHPAYPSGHATESMLMALMLEQVLPQELCTSDDSPLRSMARRIARNREVLGVHYPSDSFVGQKLAARTLPLLMTCPSLLTGDPADTTTADGFRAATPLTIRRGAAAGDSFGPVPLAAPLVPNPDDPAGPGIAPVFRESGLIARARREWA